MLETNPYIHPIEEVIPQELLGVFDSLDVTLPEGYIPPNIQGKYVFGKKEFCLSNYYDLSYDTVNVVFNFYDQHNGVVIADVDESGEAHTDTAFIMGKDNKFTLYMRQHRDDIVFMGFTFEITRSMVITGEVAGEGDNKSLKNLYYGTYINDASDSSGGMVEYYKPGRWFVFKDKDGTSVPVN